MRNRVKEKEIPAALLNIYEFCDYLSIGEKAEKKCVKNCEAEAIKIENFCAKIDSTKCTGCGKCAEGCPVGAIQLISLK